MIKEHTVDYLVLKFKDTPSQISMDSLGVYLSKIFLELFLKPVYPIMAAENFQIYGVKITGKYMHPSKTFPRSLSLFPSQKEITHSSGTLFSENLFFPKRKWGKDYGAKRMTKIKPKRVLVPSFNKCYHLCKLYIFGFCFVVPQRLKHAEVLRFFKLTNKIFIKNYSVQV